jgi:hypothetical protein
VENNWIKIRRLQWLGKGNGQSERLEEEQWIMCLDELKLKVRKLIFYQEAQEYWSTVVF